MSAWKWRIYEIVNSTKPLGRSRRGLFHTFLFQDAGALVQPPFVDYLDVEPPVAANLETGQLALLQQAVDGRAMYSKILGQFIDCQNFSR
jgi:hypothetical protein